MSEKVIIMEAAGRDFHNFNIYFKDNSRYEVIAFTNAPSRKEKNMNPWLTWVSWSMQGRLWTNP